MQSRLRRQDKGKTKSFIETKAECKTKTKEHSENESEDQKTK